MPICSVPATDRRAAAIGVVAGERERGDTLLGERPWAADLPAGEEIGIGEERAAAHHKQHVAARRKRRRVLQRATVECERARGSAEIGIGGDGYRAGVEHRAAKIGVRAGKGQRACAALLEAARAADDAAEGDRVRPVEGQYAVVRHIAREAAGYAAVADLQRAGADRRAAGDRCWCRSGWSCRRRAAPGCPRR